MRYFSLFLILLSASLIFISCNDDPTSIGSNLIPKTDNLNFKVLDSYQSDLSQKSTYFDEKIIYGNSDKVFLGKTSYSEASAMFRYSLYLVDTTLTKVINKELQIERAWMQVVPKYTIGDNSASFDFTVHQIRSAWSTYGFDRDSISNLKYDNTNVGTIFSKTDTLIQFNIDPSVIYEWLKYKVDSVNTPKNYGLILKPTASTKKILGFSSTVTTGINTESLLFVVLSKTNYKDTLAVSPFLNNYTYNSTPPPPTNNFYLEGGYARKGQLYFDVSSLPKHTIINQATLELTVDTLNTLDGKPASDSIYVQMFADSTTRKLTNDSTSYIVLSRNGNKYSGDISFFLQRWENGLANNGLKLSLWDENSSTARIAFYGSKNPDKLLRPKLKIIYMQKQ